jgi:hypothetical protein
MHANNQQQTGVAGMFGMEQAARMTWLGMTAFAAAIAAAAACGTAADEPETNPGGEGGGGSSGIGQTSGQGGAPQTASGGFGGASENAGGGGNVNAGGGLPDGPACKVNGEAGVCIDVAFCVGPYAHTPGFCKGPANIQCCTKLSAQKCNPKTVVQPNAGLVEAPGVGGCPAGMVPVDTFCVDRYEATLVKVTDGKPWSPYFNPGMEQVRAVSVKGAVPQGYIDQQQAKAACLEAGKRLCSDQEWLRACRGPQKLTYPYGNTLKQGVCNDHRSVHPAVEYFGTTDSWIFSELDNACLNQLASALDAAGDNPGCVTADGAFDMMGNLHEWTADPAGTFRGGYYVDTVKNGPGCLYATTAHNVFHWDYSTGFRCCADKSN